MAETTDYVRGLRDALQEMVDAADTVMAELDGPVMTMLTEEMPATLQKAIAALITADYGRRSCGGVIDGLIDDFGTLELRTLRRELR